MNAAPESWSTLARDPATRTGLEGRARGELLLAASTESDDGHEGDVYLETRQGEVFGVWGETHVAGRIDPGGSAIDLADQGTHSVIFTGTLRDGVLDGTLMAEGERRRVRSVKARLLLGSSTSVSLPLTTGIASVAIGPGSAKWVSAPAPAEALKLEPSRLVVGAGSTQWTLSGTAYGLVGRTLTGAFVSARFDDPYGLPLPLEATGVAVRSQHLRSGGPGGPCFLDVEVAKFSGFSRAPTVEDEFLQLYLRASDEGWILRSPGRRWERPTCVGRADFLPRVQTSIRALSLPAGFLGFEGTVRTEEKHNGPRRASARCQLLDTSAGELTAEVAAAIPSEAREAVRSAVDRSLKRRHRTSRLKIDSSFTDDGFSALSESATACVTSNGLLVEVPHGVITKHGAGDPPRALVPAKVLAAALPEKHPWRRLFQALVDGQR